MAVAVVVAVIVRVVVAVVMAVIIVAAVVMAPGKGFGKNPEKSSLWREGKLLSWFLMRNGVRVRVISIPIDISPA